MSSQQKPQRLRDFFGGLTEQTFEARLGIADPPMVDYLVELLVRFIRTESLLATRNDVGDQLTEVADMMVEAETRIGEAKRQVHRQIGDFTLFWTGVYPEALAHLRASDRKDRFVDYPAEGKRAYRIASTIPTEKDAENEILGRLSHDFDMCVYGLGEVRREWERHGGSHSVIWVA
jgi:hypothetical protein